VLAAGLVTGHMVAVVAAGGGEPRQSAVQIPERTLRAQATHAPKPAYPPALVAKRIAGVAVAAVVVGPDDRVESLIVLEAPDPVMAESVHTAVRQWTFHSTWPAGRAPRARSGTVTFYFQIREGTGVVLNPDEMPGGDRLAPPALRGAAPRGGSVGPAASPRGGISAGIPPVRRLDEEMAPPSLTETEFTRLVTVERAVVLDVRDRDAFRQDHRAGAVNIPLGELDVRAPIELPASRPIVLDCSRTDAASCAIGGHFLAEHPELRIRVFSR
jgi:hypothetical protein